MLKIVGCRMSAWVRGYRPSDLIAGQPSSPIRIRVEAGSDVNWRTVRVAAPCLRSWAAGCRRGFGVIVRHAIVQNYVEQRLMHLDAAIVFDKTELAKPVHEEADPGAGGADHFSQSFLRYLRNQRLWITRFAKFRHQKKNARQAFFTGVEELIDKIGLNAHAAGQ